MFPRLPAAVATKIERLSKAPAARAGLSKGDVVLRIDDVAVQTWEELAGRIVKSTPGKPIRFTVVRDGKETTISVAPEMREGRNVFGEKVTEPKVGIAPSGEVVYKEIGPGSAFLRGVKETRDLIYLTAMTVVKLLMRVLPSETLGGPILIAQIARDQARMGISPFAYILGVLSVNLGILNLLPIRSSTGGTSCSSPSKGSSAGPISRQAREIGAEAGAGAHPGADGARLL